MIEVVVGLIVLGVGLYLWIPVYNNFQRLRQSALENLSNIEVFIQQRSDMILAIVQMAKRYNIHESTTFKETAEARNKIFHPPAEMNERVKALSDIENSFLKMQAVAEAYPDLKAELIQSRVLESDVLIETRLAQSRVEYNKVAREYNYQVQFFPKSIIAMVHGFRPVAYIAFKEKEYEPRKIYE